jgi:N-acetylglucosaminyldiphosphoundecaprenol N-acetyl-beta-D-mannosaminyltransferase
MKKHLLQYLRKRNTKESSMLGIAFRYENLKNAVADQMQTINDGSPCRQIIFANSYSVCLARNRPSFSRVLHSADFVYPDGISIVLAARVLGIPIYDRVAGPDFMLELLAQTSPLGIRSFFLGGQNTKVLNDLKQEISGRFGELIWAGGVSPPFGDYDCEYIDWLIQEINQSGASILWVGLGSPKQDLLIDRIKGSLKIKMAVGVGAAFDFHSRQISRAPLWMQHWGFEWLFRLGSDPKRLWKRYLLGNLQFMFLLAKEVFSRK